MNHITSSVFLPAYTIYAQVTHTIYVWFAWKRGMQRRFSRGLIAPTARASLCFLLSRKALFSKEGSFISVPRGASPASAEAEWRQHSWGWQRDLMEGSETSEYLSPSSPIRSDDRSPRLEACQVDTWRRGGPGSGCFTSW